MDGVVSRRSYRLVLDPLVSTLPSSCRRIPMRHRSSRRVRVPALLVITATLAALIGAMIAHAERHRETVIPSSPTALQPQSSLASFDETFLELADQLELEGAQELPHRAVSTRMAFLRKRKETARARCPANYIFDDVDEECKCPSGTSGKPRSSPEEATNHEVAERDHRCCRAMKLPLDCEIPCCFCTETVVPWMHPHDCEKETPLRQAAWWRRKKLEHDHTARQVRELQEKLKQAKREHEKAEHQAAAIPVGPSTPNSSPPPSPSPLPLSTASSASSPSPPTTTAASAHAPPPQTGRSEAQVKQDVKSLFMNSLVHP